MFEFIFRDNAHSLKDIEEYYIRGSRVFYWRCGMEGYVFKEELEKIVRTGEKKKRRVVDGVKVIQTNKDGDFIAEYRSIAEASRRTKIPLWKINKVLEGEWFSTYGYRFERKV